MGDRVSNAKGPQRIMCAGTGYAGHIPGLKSNNIVGHDLRASRRLSKAESAPPQEPRGVRPGVADVFISRSSRLPDMRNKLPQRSGLPQYYL